MSGAVAQESQPAPQARGVSLVSRVAARYSVDPAKMLDTLKATAFRLDKGEVSNEQMMALLVVADQHKLNPFTREIFAFPDKSGGVVPVVSIDGWARIINEHAEFNGVRFQQCADIWSEGKAKPCPEWIEAVIHRKDREYPCIVREYIDECYRPMGAWQTHTKRMLRHKALMQCARIAFGFTGIYDQDEAERIIEGRVIEDPETGSQADKLNRAIMGLEKKPESEASEGNVPPAGMAPPDGQAPGSTEGGPPDFDAVAKMLREAETMDQLAEAQDAVNAFPKLSNERQALRDLEAEAQRRLGVE